MVSTSPINKHDLETEISIRPPNTPVSIARSDLFDKNIPRLSVVAVHNTTTTTIKKKKVKREN